MRNTTLKERVAIVETEMKGMDIHLRAHAAENRIDFDTLFKLVREMPDKIEEKQSCRYAGRWTEKVLIGVIIASAGAIITGLIILF